MIADAKHLVEIAERVNVHLCRVEHCLEVGVIECKRFLIALDGVFELALQRGNVSEQIVRFGGLAIEFQSSTSGQLCATRIPPLRSEEHTSELQSQSNLVCRLLLEKKKKKIQNINQTT